VSLDDFKPIAHVAQGQFGVVRLLPVCLVQPCLRARLTAGLALFFAGRSCYVQSRWPGVLYEDDGKGDSEKSETGSSLLSPPTLPSPNWALSD
jgi:hypothetical protein